MWVIIIIAGVLVVIFVAWWIWRWATKVPGTPAGKGSIYNFPPLPPGTGTILGVLSLAITPMPFPTRINSAGVAVSVSVTGGGGSTNVPFVPVKVMITERSDPGISSIMRIVVPSKPKPETALGLNGYTDANGLLNFTLSAIGETGGADDITITALPGTSRQIEKTFSYTTVVP